MNLTKGKRMMDELDLIQEAVSNWESLYEVEEVETWELSSGTLGESTTVARILTRNREAPIYIEMRALHEVDDGLKELLENGKPVMWSRPGHSLN